MSNPIDPYHTLTAQDLGFGVAAAGFYTVLSNVGLYRLAIPVGVLATGLAAYKAKTFCDHHSGSSHPAPLIADGGVIALGLAAGARTVPDYFRFLEKFSSFKQQNLSSSIRNAYSKAFDIRRSSLRRTFFAPFENFINVNPDHDSFFLIYQQKKLGLDDTVLSDAKRNLFQFNLQHEKCHAAGCKLRLQVLGVNGLFDAIAAGESSSFTQAFKELFVELRTYPFLSSNPLVRIHGRARLMFHGFPFLIGFSGLSLLFSAAKSGYKDFIAPSSAAASHR